MPKQEKPVGQFIAELAPPVREMVERIRGEVLASNDQITERIKWNAPSFCFKGDDRVTFRLPPGKDFVQLVFHRGAKARPNQTFSFQDASGLLEWVAKDRAVVTFRVGDDVATRAAALTRVVNAWLEATT